MRESAQDVVIRPSAQPAPIDPLRRVFVPIEKRTEKGTMVFKTLDNTHYARLEDGSIRRTTPKEHGKAARRRRAQARMKQP